MNSLLTKPPGKPRGFVEIREELGMGESEFKMLYVDVSLNILPLISWFVTNRDDNVPEELNTKPSSVNLPQPQGCPSLKGFRIGFSR